MVLGWRRAFCTSIPRDRETRDVKEKKEESNIDTNNPSPRLGSKFGFFSNPSTPRLQSQTVSSPGLRCRTTATVPAVSVPESPKLQCKTKNTPRLFNRSNPSSPRSPSTFSLLKSSLRLSKSRCGICLQSVKTGQGMAIFTAECSHSFHFPCIASHVKRQSNLVCPVCSFKWKQMPLLSVQSNLKNSALQPTRGELASPNVKPKNQYSRLELKVYNDDEPLMSPTTRARFNPIPESDEENETGAGEFQGFFVNANTSPIVETINTRNVDFRLLPEAAVVSVGRNYETYAIVLKVRAPPAMTKTASRAPIDLVTVLDVSGSMNNEKLQMMKRAMRLVVSSLSSSDRLSIVAFSTNSKRLLPLRRMTTVGRRAARRIIDAIAVLDGTSSSNDALKKAAKVLEDRREKNDVASIMLLSDDRPSTANAGNQRRHVFSTRYSHLEIPVHSIGFNQNSACGESPREDSFAKSVGGLLSVVAQDLRFSLGFLAGSAAAEIAAVYSHTGQPVSLGSCSIRIGDLYAEEERELLVEMKVPSVAIGAQHIISVQSSYRDPTTQEVIYGKEQALLVPKPQAVRSSSIQRLRNLFVATRAIAESRKLVERNDTTGAQRMLSSARALLLQSSSDSAEEFARGLEAELSELPRRRQIQNLNTQRELAYVDEKGEPLTPTSAWRAAERLAKVAIMRKSLNRVSDLHGFEDARF
ncbi:hypothetical protein LguiA_005967 [Lonicera macranthoides]